MIAPSSPMTPTPKQPYPRKSHARSSNYGAKQNQKLGNIRIISGKHRGRKLPVILSDGLRPTTDRTKETLFNWLMHDIQDAKVLDMFAGAGSLGFEALSRHAAYVTMIEKDPKVAKQLQSNLVLLQEQQRGNVICGDALTALGEQTHHFDIIFIDPPFGKIETQTKWPSKLLFISF